jgi:hypothetical protein
MLLQAKYAQKYLKILFKKYQLLQNEYSPDAVFQTERGAMLK